MEETLKRALALTRAAEKAIGKEADNIGIGEDGLSLRWNLAFVELRIVVDPDRATPTLGDEKVKIIVDIDGPGAFFDWTYVDTIEIGDAYSWLTGLFK